MDSISDKIKNRIQRGGRGHFVASSDFCDIANDATIRQTLKRLENKGMLMKIDNGLWFYPESIYGVIIEKCDPELIAKELKARYGIHSARIPTDLLFELGIDVESLPYYYTSGPTRHFKFLHDLSVTFQHTSDQTMFAISSHLVRDIYICLRIIGQNNITEEQVKLLRSKVELISNSSLRKNRLLFKAWMQKIFVNSN